MEIKNYYQMKRIINKYSGKKIKYFLVKCPNCNKERFVRYGNLKRMKSELCISCSAKKTTSIVNQLGYRNLPVGKESHLFKKGYTLNDSGYKIVSLHQQHPFRKMADKNGRCRLHRLIYAEYINRPLEKFEIIHHKNGNKLDNNIKNLELIKDRISHLEHTFYQNEINRLKGELCLLQSKK